MKGLWRRGLPLLPLLRLKIFSIKRRLSRPTPSQYRTCKWCWWQKMTRVACQRWRVITQWKLACWRLTMMMLMMEYKTGKLTIRRKMRIQHLARISSSRSRHYKSRRKRSRPTAALNFSLKEKSVCRWKGEVLSGKGIQLGTHPDTCL